MSIVFAVRSDQLDARYSLAGKEAGAYGASANAGQLVNDASAIGGQAIDLGVTDNNRGAHAIMYNGRKNFPTSNKYSLLYRVYYPDFSGVRKMFMAGTEFEDVIVGLSISYRHDLSQYAIVVTDDTPKDVSDDKKISANPPTGQWVDFVLTAKLDGTSDNVECFIDGSSIGTLTFGDTITAPRDHKLFQQIIIGASNRGLGSGTKIRVNEVVLWNDEIIDPTNVPLANGSNGSLNGTSRSEFVDVDSFDGLKSTNPGTNNVVNGVDYFIDGVQYTGTRDVTTIKLEDSVVDSADRNFTVEAD